MEQMAIQFLLLLAGWGLHTLSKLHELDKETAGSVRITAVIWDDAARWRTITLLGFMLIVAFTGQVDALFAAAGITVEGTAGMALLLVSAGYNIDSLSNKVLALAKPKPE